MSKYDDLEAVASKGRTAALERLESRMMLTQRAQAAVVKRALELTIKDKLVDPKSATFYVDHDSRKVCLSYGREHASVTIHSHAMGQLADISQVTRLYVRRLLEGCVGMGQEDRHILLTHVLNTHFHEGIYLDRKKNPTKFLHRTVGTELRGVLSRNYNRKLGTMTMLRPFIEEAMAFGAEPVEAYSSPVKMAVTYMLPHIFEPVPGEFVTFGVQYANSDFGAGGLHVAGTVFRISSGSVAVLGDKLSRVHLGAVIEEAEIELSEETLAKEAAAHVSALRDMVKKQLDPKNVYRVLSMIEYADKHEMSWLTLKDKLRTVLHKTELQTVEEMLQEANKGIVELPPVKQTADGDPVATAWWASAVLGHLAEKVEDVDRKGSIHNLAGKLLAK